MKRSGFLKRRTPLRSKTRIKRESPDDTAQCKKRIQALLRQLAIQRDGGCVLRHYTDIAGRCGGYRGDGELILQAEHLNTRARNISYGDMRNIVCLCSHHHGHWKPEHSREYWKLIEQIIGPERQAWLDRIQADQRPYHMVLWDWQKLEMELRQQLKANELI